MAMLISLKCNYHILHISLITKSEVVRDITCGEKMRQGYKIQTKNTEKNVDMT